MNELDETSAAVTRTQIVRFAGAAGDFNPMHHDEPFATAAGQPGVFAMGQLPAAMLASAVSRWLSDADITAFGVRFTEKVWPGDELTLTGSVVEERDGVRRCELRATRAADGVEVLRGHATARVH